MRTHRYMGTTGMPTMDWLIGDRVATPPEYAGYALCTSSTLAAFHTGEYPCGCALQAVLQRLFPIARARVCVCVCACVCVSARARVRERARACVCVSVRVCTCMCVRMHACGCVCVPT
jgi:hypothetical protein